MHVFIYKLVFNHKHKERLLLSYSPNSEIIHVSKAIDKISRVRVRTSSPKGAALVQF